MKNPIDGDEGEGESVDGEEGRDGAQASEAALVGTWSSSTMMVMMTAMTPSEKASEAGLGSWWKFGMGIGRCRKA